MAEPVEPLSDVDKFGTDWPTQVWLRHGDRINARRAKRGLDPLDLVKARELLYSLGYGRPGVYVPIIRLLVGEENEPPDPNLIVSRLDDLGDE